MLTMERLKSRSLVKVLLVLGSLLLTGLALAVLRASPETAWQSPGSFLDKRVASGEHELASACMVHGRKLAS